jgi:hypothetical protein
MPAPRRAARKLLYRAFVCLVGIVAIGLLSNVAIATDEPIGLKIVWSAALPGIPRLCYDKTPAVLFMKYDVTRKSTSVFTRKLNRDEHLLGEFPGSPDMRSLSCSQDGRTIAALGGERSTLFLRRGTETALYRISGYWPFSNAGRYSFLAQDGNSITLPERPDLVSGPDLLHDMTIFPDKLSTVFFMDGYLYLDDKAGIHKLPAVDGGWAEHGQQFKKPGSFDASEIVRCGDHDVASLVGMDSSRYMVLGDGVRSQDWLERVGVRKLVRKYYQPFLISGDYGTCGFPLRDRARSHETVGLARIDTSGVQTFSFPYPELRLINDNVAFSKDGCLALIQGVWIGREALGNTHLLAVESPQCR